MGQGQGRWLGAGRLGRRGGCWRLGVVVLGAVVGLTCQPSEAPPNLLLVTIDTLRADHLGAYGYFRETSPEIDALARDGLLFERAFVPMPTTLPSHVSLMTGTYPVRHGVVSNYRYFLKTIDPSPALPTLAERLRAQGYRTAAFTSSSPLSAETGIAAGFEEFRGPDLISFARGRIDVRAEETVDAALAWLTTTLGASPAPPRPGTGEPFFLWIHLFDPHDPYDPPAEHRQFATDAALLAELDRRGIATEDRAFAAQSINAYDGEIHYADRQTGRVLAELARREMLARTVIVLVGDHGEGLFQHGEQHHTQLWNEQLRVPLILRAPSGPRGRDARLASLIDVLPTLAGLGLPIERSRLDGIDLGRESRRLVLGQRDVRRGREEPSFVLVDGRWKLWSEPDVPPRLYDLETDPAETTDLAARHVDISAGMRDELDRLLGEQRRLPGLAVHENISAEDRRRLEELGYLQ